MNIGGTSGTLGTTQVLAFASAASTDAIRDGAAELGFAQVVIETGDVTSAREYLKANASPEILLVEISSAEAAPAQLDALADVVNPHTKVLVCGPVDSYRFYHWLMDLGIHEYLLQPFTASQFKQAIIKGAAKKQEAAANAAPQLKKIVAVIGARGGVGTTTIATNLGAIFARDHGLNTAIIDLDPYFGSVALGLDLEPTRGLRDALEKPDRIDSLFLERVMVKPFTGLSILSAEEPLQDPLTAQSNAGEMLFAALLEKFNMILVDLPRQMNPLARYVLANADHVVIVAEPQLTSLRDSLRLKDLLVEQLKRPSPLVVMNRVGQAPKQELPSKDFTKHYGQAPNAQLSYLTEAITATAQGELLVDAPKLSSSLAPLRMLASLIHTPEAAAGGDKTGGSLLARLKAKK